VTFDNIPSAGVDDSPPPRVVLICHRDDQLNREGLARWLASFADLVGIVELDEPRQRLRQRVRREIRRVGVLRSVDVLAFRLHQRMFQRRKDAAWENRRLAQLCQQFTPLPGDLPILKAPNPNTADVEAFVRGLRPDLMLARCKTLLKERIFSLPRLGTFVLHPGICPQYRNAHGCFWAMAEDDFANVGATLLKIDRGVDTGPVYGCFRGDYDPLAESHHVIQHRVVFDHLPEIEARLREIAAGTAQPIDTQGLPSSEWGQPWLTAYLRLRRRALQSSRHTPCAVERDSGLCHQGNGTRSVPTTI
jgi:hypothetical protein